MKKDYAGRMSITFPVSPTSHARSYSSIPYQIIIFPMTFPYLHVYNLLDFYAVAPSLRGFSRCFEDLCIVIITTSLTKFFDL